MPVFLTVTAVGWCPMTSVRRPLATWTLSSPYTQFSLFFKVFYIRTALRITCRLYWSAGCWSSKGFGREGDKMPVILCWSFAGFFFFLSPTTEPFKAQSCWNGKILHQILITQVRNTQFPSCPACDSHVFRCAAAAAVNWLGVVIHANDLCELAVR